MLSFLLCQVLNVFLAKNQIKCLTKIPVNSYGVNRRFVSHAHASQASAGHAPARYDWESYAPKPTSVVDQMVQLLVDFIFVMMVKSKIQEVFAKLPTHLALPKKRKMLNLEKSQVQNQK